MSHCVALGLRTLRLANHLNREQLSVRTGGSVTPERIRELEAGAPLEDCEHYPLAEALDVCLPALWREPSTEVTR